MRREFTLVLLAGAAGAGLVVFAVRQAWAQAIFTPPRPLPAQDERDAQPADRDAEVAEVA